MQVKKLYNYLFPCHSERSEESCCLTKKILRCAQNDISYFSNVSLIVCLFLCFSANAQTSKMTIEEAVALALKNNYGISIAKNQAKQAQNNNTLGNAGMLPKVDLNATQNFANNTTKQEFSTGLIIDRRDVQSQNITTGAYLTWTIFDGIKMFATHQKLQELEVMGELNAKIQIENIFVSVISAYYTISMQKQLISGLKENISVSEERLKIAQKKFDIGSSSKTDVLQAKIDFNALLSALIRQKNLLTGAKSDLNQLLMLPVEQDIDVYDSIPLMANYKYEDLKNSILTKNANLLFAEKNIKVSKYMINEGKSTYYPRLNLHANYIFSRAQNQAGLTLLNQNLGLNLGFTATWTIFNGLNTINAVKNLQLNFENANNEYEIQKSLVQLALIKAFNKFQGDIQILDLEESNRKLVQENLSMALERFRLGASTSLELKEAQRSYEDAINRLAGARYSAKISETQLLKVSGDIVK